MLKLIATENAPKAIGPYSQAIRANGFIFVSGQIPIDPNSQEIVRGSVAEQTRQVLTNLVSILAAAGSDTKQVVKTTVYLKDMGSFEEMNKVYSQFFDETKPARATIEVARLPKDVSIEIDAIALE